ncbi:hypothetical protein FBUS_07509 [Fasciolopsis buskii]|uniref:Uncharacterized protein n=1 Tax=Fasciolopsis buskii TaxID=27845 RepID=A0A8E0S0D6_9TREM|nr:hypothetical protein FBUS_07509 [Fasciolopsis buski]
MLDVEVVPEVSLRHKNWEFLLGMPIQQMIEILRKQDNIIRSVDFWYNHKVWITSAHMILFENILVSIRVKLGFGTSIGRITVPLRSVSAKIAVNFLQLIEIYDLSRVNLRYWAQYFNSSTVTPTVQEVLRIFGSTKPLLPVESDGSYRLSYRGITFFMTPIPLCSGSLDQASSLSPLPCASSSEQTLVVTRLFIYSGSNLSEAKISQDLPSACYMNNVFLERLEVLRSASATSALKFHLVSQGTSTKICMRTAAHLRSSHPPSTWHHSESKFCLSYRPVDLNVNPTREPQTRRFTRKLHFGATVQSSHPPSTWHHSESKFCLSYRPVDLNVNPTREPQTRRFTRKLHFGATVQDVLSALGSPSRIFYKTEDKMQIHMPKWYRVDQPRGSDYFFNYFTLGVDILVDGQTHQVIKFILHTNQPGEYTFNTYYRCFFEIPLVSNVSDVEKTLERLSDGDPVECFTRSSTTGANANFIVTPFVKWSTVQRNNEALLSIEPVVIHRSVKVGKNIFGSTLAYGYQDMVFEVIPNCDYLASVTLYIPARRVHS